MKPILCLDFDGVIHSYTSGWKGAHIVPDRAVPGAFAFIIAASEHFTIAVYSSRSHQPGGIVAMQEWMRGGFLAEFAGQDAMGRTEEILGLIQWPLEKPAAFLTIDDRAMMFNGDWSAFDPAELRKFKPWNKR